MNDAEFASIETILQSKPAQVTLEWSEMREFYFMTLANVPSQHVPAIQRWILWECKTWRPTTDQVYDFCQRLAGVVEVNGVSVYAEVKAAALKYGLHGRTDPNKPSFRIEGEPAGLSPHARRFILARGGWQTLVETLQLNDYFRRAAETEIDAICQEMKFEEERAKIDPLRLLLERGDSLLERGD